MGFGLLLAGLILLVNPVIHVVDIIPDAIGFFLIVAGLTKMSYFIGKIAQARDLFFKLAFVEVVKFFSVLFIPYTSGSAKVLLAFVFGVAELILIIPAVNALFEGLSFAGLWYSGTAMYQKKSAKRFVLKKSSENGKNRYRIAREKCEIEMLTHLKRTILGFYIFRIIATLLPELTELEMYDYLGEVKAIQRSLVSYKPFLYVVLSTAVVIVGIISIRRMASFFGGIRRDKKFISAMWEKYENDVLPKDTFFTAISMRRSLLLFMFAAVASLIIPIDGVNLLVGAISSILLIVAAFILKKYAKLAMWVIPLAGLRSVLSIVNLVLQIRYFSEYSVEAVEWIETAYNQYYTMCGVATVEYIVGLASVLLFLTALMKAIKGHLENFGIQTDNAQYSKRNRDLETYNTVGGKLLLCSILAILHYAFACVLHYMLPQMSVISVISTVVTLIYIAYIVHTVNAIGEMIYDKEIEMN